MSETTPRTEVTHLTNGEVSLVLAARAAMPHIVHWGRALTEESIDGLLAATSRPLPNGTLDREAPIGLVTEHAAGFPGAPGIEGFRHDGSAWAPRFALVGTDGNEHRVRFDLKDAPAGLGLTVDVELDPGSGVARLAATVTNAGPDEWHAATCALAVPLPSRADELLDFTGRWCDEFHPRRQCWEAGASLRENRRGRTSHDSVPVLFAGSAGFDERRGDVWGFHLGWSGNSRVRAEVLADGRRYVQLGELLHSGECVLGPGERLATPWLYTATSAEGLGGVSRSFHRYLRGRVGHPTPGKARPVMLNTWEAVYFDHRVDVLRSLADRAAEVGVERFVLDDGWFHGRNNDEAGLGDWWVDPQKYRDGLNPVIDHVIALGMEFGLWVEPEMVNPDSDLYREHPDWALADSAYELTLGRNQLVLDLARPDTYAYIFGRLNELLSAYEISYLKWDMNRDHTQGTHDGRAGTHAQTLAVYRLIDELRAAHPRVEIESCSSGGARIDFGILERTDRVWTSDCNDALERQRIQRGASTLLPPELTGAHIGPPVSHTTRRNHDLGFRAASAFLGHLGIEWNLLDVEVEDRAEIAEFIETWKAHRDLMHSGDVVRLEPTEAALTQGVVAQDRSEAIFVHAKVDTGRFSSPEPVVFAGLNDSRSYRVTLLPMPGRNPELGRIRPAWLTEPTAISGSVLMSAGLQMPVIDPETALVLHLTTA